MALQHPGARNKLYNLAEPEWVDHLAWARRFAGVMGWDGSIEIGDVESSASEALDWSVPLTISSKKIRDELGFREATALSERLARTVEDELARSRASSG